MAKRVSKDDFDKEVLQSELPVIVDFYSDSCIPCKQLSPILGDIEDDYEDKAKVVKVILMKNLWKNMKSWLRQLLYFLKAEKKKTEQEVL